MSKIKHLSIPEPCSQNWKDMTPGNNGRYCGSCAKTVVDFAGMTPEQILNFFAGQGNTCGRFNQFQIDTVNDKLDQREKSSSSWLKGMAAASLVGILSFLKAEGQSRVYKVEQGQASQKDTSIKMTGKNAMTSPPPEIVTGTIIGNDDKLPVPGAAVKIKGTNFGTMTDKDGRFALNVSGSPHILVVSFIGYITQETDVSNAVKTNISISMMLSPSVMGELVIVRQPFIKRMYYHLIRRPIRKLFHRSSPPKRPPLAN